GGGRVGDPSDRPEKWSAPEAGSTYDHLFWTVPVGLFRLSTTGSFVDANAKLRELLGLPQVGSASGYNLFECCLDPEAVDRWRTRLRAKGSVDDTLLALRRTDGSVIHAQVNGACLTDERGAVVAVDGSLVEVGAQHS